MTDYYDPLTWENLMAGLVAHSYGALCIPVVSGQPSAFALGVKRMCLHS